MSGFDYEEFKKYTQNFEKVTEEFETFLKSFLLQMAQRVIAKARQNTPVDTGAMRASWGIGSQSLALKSSISSEGKQTVTLDLENSQVADISVIGNTLEVTIWNGMEYSSFVEYGHSNRDGSWQEGHFILTVAIDEVQRQIPARFEKAFQEFLKNRGVG